MLSLSKRDGRVVGARDHAVLELPTGQGLVVKRS